MARQPVTTFQQTVTTSGTPVQLPENEVDIKQTMAVKAMSANTGDITVGYSSATALNTGSDYFTLAANDSLEFKDLDNARRVWIDSTVNGEGVEVAIG